VIAQQHCPTFSSITPLTPPLVRSPHRFEDAAYYFWQLSISVLVEMGESFKAGEDPSEAMLERFNDYQARANVYHPYHAVHRFMHEPFTPHPSENLFNMARFVEETPPPPVPTPLRPLLSDVYGV
jgi:hypothetical protein